MGKQAKPKVKTTTATDRPNGKKSKSSPKPANIGATGRTSGGYTEAALARRKARRASA